MKPSVWGSSTRSPKKREWLEAALELARRIASRPPLAARLAKQAVLAAEETALERRARAGAAPVRAGDGDRGPGRGHAGLPREAQARVRGTLSGGERSSRSSTRARTARASRGRRARLGRQAGSERLGASLFELEPGSAAFPMHYHLGNEETADRALRPARALRTPAGERGAGAGVRPSPFRSARPGRTRSSTATDEPVPDPDPQRDATRPTSSSGRSRTRSAPSGARRAPPARAFTTSTSAATRSSSGTARSRRPPARASVARSGSPAPGRWAPGSPSSPASAASRPCFTTPSRRRSQRGSSALRADLERGRRARAPERGRTPRPRRARLAAAPSSMSWRRAGW